MVVDTATYPSLANIHVSRQTYILRMTALFHPEKPTELLIGTSLWVLALPSLASLSLHSS